MYTSATLQTKTIFDFSFVTFWPEYSNDVYISPCKSIRKWFTMLKGNSWFIRFALWTLIATAISQIDFDWIEAYQKTLMARVYEHRHGLCWRN